MVMLRTLFALIFMIGLVACAGPAQPEVRASLGAIESLSADDTSGYTMATAPRSFSFPADHGPHPEFLTEWWYYTGNLSGPEGRHFGYQLTFFRRALAPSTPARDSAWATRDIYMAHFALSDVADKQFYAFERFSRDGAGLAGASGDPFHVFVEDWSAAGAGPEALPMQLRAAEGPIAISLDLDTNRPPVLQGDNGLSRKGPETGNASYYYSLTRMQTTGTISISGQQYTVQGLSWMDREWSTSPDTGNIAGWDWFALQLSDGSDLMFYQLRLSDGSRSPFSGGSILDPDGKLRSLGPDDIQIEVNDTWRSPRNNADYPARWKLHIPKASLELEINPYLSDQELPTTVTYWEGAVQISGTHAGTAISGNGYVELTGYADSIDGRNP